MNNALIVLAESVLNNNCKTIEATTVISLFNAALANSTVNLNKKVAQQLYHVLGKLEFYIGDYSNSFKHFDTAYLLYPKNKKPLFQKAVQYILLKDAEQAEATLNYIRDVLPFYLKHTEPLLKGLTSAVVQLKGKENES